MERVHRAEHIQHQQTIEMRELGGGRKGGNYVPRVEIEIGESGTQGLKKIHGRRFSSGDFLDTPKPYA